MIKKVYYFGSSKDGFNTYPESRIFNQYYNNAASEPWLITLRKVEDIVYHTYVQYKINTSHNDGRTGSHFGLSIATKDCYFTNMIFLYEEIFSEIIEHMIKEKRILIKNEFEAIAIGPYRLSDEKKHLDSLSDAIRSSFLKVQIFKYLKEVPSSTPEYYDKKIYGLHIKSNPTTIRQHFEKYGAVDISGIAEYPILK